MNDEGAFDVIIIGTGLTESITAAALSKAGFKVAHLDANPYYGGDEASLTLDEFIEWIDEHKESAQFTSFATPSASQSYPNSRQYSISLSPSVIPSAGPLISSLVSSGVSRYGSFRLVEQVAVYSSSNPNRFTAVPGSKEDIFKNKSISLVDKRRLMRFLMFASGDFEEKAELQGKAEIPFVKFLQETFSLNQEMADTIAYALSHCTSPSDNTLPALLRLRRYLRSAGRYGSSPFLVSHYGSSGEIAQGFCRASAVAGGAYILGKSISAISHNSDPKPDSPVYTVSLTDFPEPLTCNLIISSETLLPAELAGRPDTEKVHSTFPGIEETSTSVARCICIIDQPLSFHTSEISSTLPDNADEAASEETSPAPLDTGMLIFPPSSLPSGSAPTSVTALIVGESTMSVPSGKWIVYLSTPISSTTISAETLLKPYLDATLSFCTPPLLSSGEDTPGASPIFTSFYIQSPFSSSPSPDSSPLSTSASTEPMTPTPTPSPTILLTPPTPLSPLPEPPDSAAVNAEAVFWAAVKTLNASRAAGRPSYSSTPAPSTASEAEAEAPSASSDSQEKEKENTTQEERKAEIVENENENEVEIESFWPPLGDAQNDNEDDD